MIFEIVILVVGFLMYLIAQTQEEVDRKAAKTKYLKHLKKPKALDKDAMWMKDKITTLEGSDEELEEEWEKTNRAMESLRLLNGQKCFARDFAQLEETRLKERDIRSEPRDQSENTWNEYVKREMDQRNESELEWEDRIWSWKEEVEKSMAALNDSALEDPKF